MTQMNVNGCTTCNTLGSEKFEQYTTTIARKRVKMYQYDYRHTDGKLFSCCAKSLDECRSRRNEWLNRKNA